MGLRLIHFSIIIILCGLFVWGACKDPFEPEIRGDESGFLVVEGYINVGEDAVTTIRLSRTTPVTQPGIQLVEADALVRIEDEEGNFFELSEQSEGVYKSEALSLSLERQWRISVLTKHGKQYYSEFVQSRVTPPIDSISWRRVNEGVEIYVTTHDNENETRFYQWDYEEVWTITSLHHTFFIYQGGTVKPRPEQETIDMFRCWKYQQPQGLIYETTASLAEDIILMKPLILIPVSHEKLSDRYSVLVKQRALSEEEFNYLQLMDKNTDAVGGFSDPLPAELYGNIYCADSDEPVVGFMGAATTSEIRIFIRERDVPNWNFSFECLPPIFASGQPDSLSKYFGSLGYIPTMSDGAGGGYFGAAIWCVDCRLRGGKSGKPEFWD